MRNKALSILVALAVVGALFTGSAVAQEPSNAVQAVEIGVDQPVLSSDTTSQQPILPEGSSGHQPILPEGTGHQPILPSDASDDTDALSASLLQTE